MADDEFGRAYLGTDDALFVDRVRQRAVAVSMLSLGAVFGAGAVGLGIAGAVTSSGILVGAIASAALAVGYGTFGLLFSVIRVVVSRDEIRVHTGLSDHHIPIEAIHGVSVQPFDRAARDRLRGSGEQDLGARARGGMRAVRVAWREDGRSRVSWIASDHPDVLADAIEKARSLRKGRQARVELVEHEGAEEIEAPEREASEVARESARRRR
jgi:hypothetical protein